MSDENGFVSISEAAGALGISERQARRYAGRLDAGNRREAGQGAGHEAGRASGLTVNLAAMRAARELATGEADNKHETAIKGAASHGGPDVPTDTTPDMRPDAETVGAGRQAGHGPDAVLIDELRDQVKFLRGVVEQHQRSEAELRNALRTALAAMPRALTEGTAKPVEIDGNSDRQVLAADGSHGATEARKFRARDAQRPKMAAWKKIGARILGIRP